MAAGKKLKMGSVTFDCIETGQKVIVDVVTKGDQVSFNSTFDPPLDRKKPIKFSPITHMYATLMETIKNGGMADD